MYHIRIFTHFIFSMFFSCTSLLLWSHLFYFKPKSEASIVSHHTPKTTQRHLVHPENKHGVIQQHISEQIGPKGLLAPPQEGKGPNPVSSLDDQGQSQGIVTGDWVDFRHSQNRKIQNSHWDATNNSPWPITNYVTILVNNIIWITHFK